MFSGRYKISDDGRGTYLIIKWHENLGDGGWIVAIIKDNAGYVGKNKLYKVHSTPTGRVYINIGVKSDKRFYLRG